MGFQIIRRVLAGLLLLSSAPAPAQDSSSDSASPPADASAEQPGDAAAMGTAWHASVGPGRLTQPRYPGARVGQTIWFPYVDAQYGRWYTSGTDLLGFYAYDTKATQLGAAIDYDLTARNPADDIRLHGLPDVPRSTRFKLFGTETVSAFTGDLSVMRDIDGHGTGTVGQTNAWVSLPIKTFMLISVGPGLSWGDREYMQRFFAVDAPTASLPAFYARAGVDDTHLNALAQWQPAAHLQIGVLGYFAHLRGSALQSPIALQHEQTTLTSWIAYRFR